MKLSVVIDVYYIYGNISRIYHKVNVFFEKIQKLNFSDTFLYKKNAVSPAWYGSGIKNILFRKSIRSIAPGIFYDGTPFRMIFPRKFGECLGVNGFSSIGGNVEISPQDICFFIVTETDSFPGFAFRQFNVTIATCFDVVLVLVVPSINVDDNAAGGLQFFDEL